MGTSRTIRLLILLASMLGLLIGLQAFPSPAHAAGFGKTAKVCAVDLPKSWTKGLEKAANRQFNQRVDVKRVDEDNLGGCEVIIWLSNEDGSGQAVNPVTGQKAGRYFVLTGTPYNAHKVEINVGSGTPNNQRKATVLKALGEVLR